MRREPQAQAADFAALVALSLVLGCLFVWLPVLSRVATGG
jgi:hypothetical protein